MMESSSGNSPTAADQLRDANERLLLAGLHDHEMVGQAEAASRASPSRVPMARGAPSRYSFRSTTKR